MHANTGSPPSPRTSRDRDVDRSGDRPQETPKGCRAPVAQNRALSTGEHRSHPSPLLGGTRVANRIDTLMQTMQPPKSRSPRYPAGAQSSRQELAVRDHTMLPRRSPGDDRVGPGEFLPHSDIKSPRLPDSPPAIPIAGGGSGPA